MCSGMVGSFCSTNGTRRVNQVTPEKPLYYIMESSLTETDWYKKSEKIPRGNQKSNTEDGQTTQWSKVRRYQGVIRSRTLKTDRQYNGQKLEDTKG